MPDTAKKAPTITFLQYHQPELTVGEYQITVQQEILGSTLSSPPFETKRSFSVAGERFSLNPQDIHAVFPPDGSLGGHDNVLPHILLNRSTLPWEREVTPSSSDKIPWLALLLFHETDPLPSPQVLTLKDLKQHPQWSDLVLETGQQETDRVMVIDVKAELLHNILPSRDDLKYLAHVRQADYYQISDRSLERFTSDRDILTTKLKTLKSQEFNTQDDFLNKLKSALGEQDAKSYGSVILQYARNRTDTTSYQITDQTLKNLETHFNEIVQQLKSLQEQDFDTDETFLEQLKSTIGEANTERYHSIILPLSCNRTELAVIISNRLPQKGGISTAHLVSLEKVDFQKGQAGNDPVRLISLKNWRFACEYEETYQITAACLKQLESKIPSNILTALTSLQDQEFRGKLHFSQILEARIGEQQINPYQSLILQSAFYAKQTFKGLLTHLNREPNTLRLPPVTDTQAEHYLAMGYVPLPHHLRQGGKTISWYHSPLLPGKNTSPDDTQLLPIRAADALLRYNPSNGMFDISYAAAWELGRLLALQSKDFSINLYNWKRTHVQQLKQAEQKLVHPHLPTPEPSSEASEIPKSITDWFRDLSLLKGVPFNYLVPDEQMLPPESIRFFWVDSLWIDCLLDGAFSIGRVAISDYQRDRSLVTQTKINPDHPPLPPNPAVNPHDTLTGLLLRSDVVAGWPGLLVDAYSEILLNNDTASPDTKLNLLRMERLSPNVLLCLFAGEIKTVDIHQKPETLHFGLDRSDDKHIDFYKTLRDKQGKASNQEIHPIPWKKENNGIVDIDRLVMAIQQKLSETPFTSANFALQMIEGVEKVRFTQMSHSR